MKKGLIFSLKVLLTIVCLPFLILIEVVSFIIKLFIALVMAIYFRKKIKEVGINPSTIKWKINWNN